jgi:hypothetical protein
LTLQGTFIAARSFHSEPTSSPRPAGAQLQFTGGFHAQSGANIEKGWPVRTYTYQAPPEGMLLPFFVDMEAYNVKRGRYN